MKLGHAPNFIFVISSSLATFFFQEESWVFGRGGKTRTRDTWFWRPVLYQLSYAPNFANYIINLCYNKSN